MNAAAAVGDDVSSEAFRGALARFASGVTIVAVWTADGPAGFTASAFTSVSLDPPLVLVCVGREVSAHGAVVGASNFGVSILAEEQRAIAEGLGRRGGKRFRDVPLRDGAPAPLVEGALVQLTCRRYAAHEAGDHTVLLGEVVRCRERPGAPLVHCDRRWGRFSPA